MTTFKNLAAFVISCYLVIPHATQSSMQQEGITIRDLLEQRVNKLVIHAETVLDAFKSVIGQGNLPGGMIIDNRAENEMNFTLSLTSEDSLRQALDRLVHANPHFRWRQDGRAIILVPESGVPSIFHTHISAFDFDDIDNRSLLVQYLFETPELKERLRALGLYFGGSGIGLGPLYPPGKNGPPRRSVHLRNVSLIEALNLIAQQRRNGFWVYQQFQLGGKEYVSVTFVQ